MPNGVLSSTPADVRQRGDRQAAPHRAAWGAAFHSLTTCDVDQEREHAMKRWMTYACLLAVGLIAVPRGMANPMNELIDALSSDYESLTPAPHSSVNTDYAIRQVARSTFVTNKSLELIYEQNAELLNRQQDLMERYDRMIEQNDEMIRLLSTIATRAAAQP
jgi:hypothetical protein